MSEYETTDNESSDSDDEPTANALPWPDTSLELANKVKPRATDTNLESAIKVKRQQNEAHSRSPPQAISENVVSRRTCPWSPDYHKGNLPKEVNVLLLGESGVGKSTFINSFANYMKHEHFEAVQQNNLSVLIPARFHIFDKDFEEHLVEIGANDSNEYMADGAAATQHVKTYIFYVTIENISYKIRFIDTPGIGDPRGIHQDNKNCDYVLSYLGRLEKLHAICLLLKPTNTRLDVFLNYCITQILSRLEKSATENISFLFTNTRGQNYTPGETYTSLKLLVKKIKDTNDVFLPLSQKNVFCFDNEAFRFLAAVKQNVEFREGILEANIESWKYSYKEVYRLLSYIVELKPHDPKKTVSINHARKMVLQLSQPLAEIVQLIGDNLYELDQHTHQLLMENQTLDQLKQKLHMPVIDIRVKELPQPVTICTAPNCSAIYKVAGKNKFHYKQRCHNPCYLNNVPAEIVGDPHILQCWAMNKSNQTCHQCNCRFNTHMHIYYETDTFENKIVDENVLRNINTKEDAAKEKENVINKILNHKEELEKEHKYIIKCTAAFAHFLQQNAITPFNDSLKEYIKYLITREENLGPNANRDTLSYLRRLLSEYEQEKSVLEAALNYDTAGNGVYDNSPQAIERKVRELFTLKHFGIKIKQLYDLHQSGALTEHKQSEFVVKEVYNLSIVDKFKSIGGSVMNALGFSKRRQKEDDRLLQIELEMQQRIYLQMFQNMNSRFPEMNLPNGAFLSGHPSSLDSSANYELQEHLRRYFNYNLAQTHDMNQRYRNPVDQYQREENHIHRGGHGDSVSSKNETINMTKNGAISKHTIEKNPKKKGQKAIQVKEEEDNIGVTKTTGETDNQARNTKKGKKNKKKGKAWKW